MAWPSDLARHVSGHVLTDDATREAAAADFGRVVIRKPEAVVRPASAEDVAVVLKFASRQSLGVSTRGAAHSQSGQSLSEHIVLDMCALDQVRRLNRAAGTVVCQGGVKWRSLVEQLAPQRFSPPVLTNNLDVTVGGTLSTAGLGVASWRHGTQADHCVEVEVVTGTGEVLRCSPYQDPELFDAVRAGMGQFGVITEATLEVRRHQPRFRSYYLLYDNLDAVMNDLKLLMREPRFDYLEAWCVPCPQGFKKVGAARQAFAQWFFPLHATVEAGDGPADASLAGGGSALDASKLEGLNFYKRVHTEEGDILEFFTRLDSLFEIWKRAGFWEYAHPWMECVLPWQAASFYIGQVLANLPSQAIAGGHILLWPARADASRVPLFIRPAGDPLLGFGILPAVPRPFLEEALPRLNQASAASVMMGGKRYLSGWINFDHRQWQAHYGEHWARVVELKKKYDPHQVLNPGFVKYEASGATEIQSQGA